MIYVDTSLLVAALTNEPATDLAQRWLAAQQAGELVISDWAVTEFASALSIKTRMGHLTLTDQRIALQTFTSMSEQSLDVQPLTRSDFRAAAQFAGLADSGIGSGDALHLAATARLGAVLHTLDQRLTTVATSVGVEVRFLN